MLETRLRDDAASIRARRIEGAVVELLRVRDLDRVAFEPRAGVAAQPDLHGTGAPGVVPDDRAARSASAWATSTVWPAVRPPGRRRAPHHGAMVGPALTCDRRLAVLGDRRAVIVHARQPGCGADDDECARGGDQARAGGDTAAPALQAPPVRWAPSTPPPAGTLLASRSSRSRSRVAPWSAGWFIERLL